MRTLLPAASAALALTVPLAAQDAAKPAAPAPSEIVAAAPRADWTPIPAEDLLVMTLAPDADGKPRQVVIQLIPAPFSQGWVHNIRLLARAKWYDGISVNRVQDNYVTQWGDPNYDNPEATGKPKPLPQGLKVMTQAEYAAPASIICCDINGNHNIPKQGWWPRSDHFRLRDSYSQNPGILNGFPAAHDRTSVWPTHCYGMVGVGRNYSPDTGSGAELYTVIGHAPRHLDRNIALVGRVVEGMQFLSSLPRGSGDLGFYTAAEADKRTPILTVRVASDLPPAEQPKFEYLSTESGTFAAYAEAIANRRDPFFIVPAGGADICNIKVPVRRVVAGQ
ncbi:peptidylprolyl isomerase [Erythrobacter sp. WG]|uniref:peptidylprolyl isomerase n=1 Tax=Erythrobacter sp. WG TaxID=2985510 RepID=UPI0022702197|nr:peptidylprolyl isomerase [Erythrobacter sp. WG]MCX9147951.1 peptidylprolyl isomerase [Erythrobacter sp. WG]